MDPRILYSVQSALLFMAISSPILYKGVQAILGKLIPIASADGCPTLVGLLVHSIVFGLVVYLLMTIQGKKEDEKLEKFLQDEEKNAF